MTNQICIGSTGCVLLCKTTEVTYNDLDLGKIKSLIFNSKDTHLLNCIVYTSWPLINFLGFLLSIWTRCVVWPCIWEEGCKSVVSVGIHIGKCTLTLNRDMAPKTGFCDRRTVVVKFKETFLLTDWIFLPIINIIYDTQAHLKEWGFSYLKHWWFLYCWMRFYFSSWHRTPSGYDRISRSQRPVWGVRKRRQWWVWWSTDWPLRRSGQRSYCNLVLRNSSRICNEMQITPCRFFAQDNMKCRDGYYPT